MKKLCIFGSGGFSKEIYFLADTLGKEVVAFIDVKEKDPIYNVPVETIKFFDPTEHQAVIAVGDPKLRKKIALELSGYTEFPHLIHPTVIVSPTVYLGKGAVVCANSILTADIRIGDFAQLNLATTIGHDCNIGNYLTLSPGTKLSGNTKVGDEVFFGTNSCSIENIEITSNVIIGAGAVVNKNIEIPGIYVGIPAKMILPKSIKEINAK